jgi:hypothetical protein
MISIQQAAANALATWLASKLPGDVDVDSHWREPTEQLPPKSLTVLLAGPADDELIDPVVVSQTNDPTDPIATYTYRFRCRRQALQLDVFTQYDADRDDIMARLDYALNAGATASLGADYNTEPIRNGLSLALADGWSGIAEFLFEGPAVSDTTDSEQTTDFRATYRGHVDMMLTYTTPTAISRMAVIELRQRAHEALGAPTNLSTDVAAQTADGESYTQE